MAELATIARPYAQALFVATQADVNASHGWLEELAQVAQDGLLQQFAANPKATDQQVFDLVSAALKTALPAMGQNFLRTLVENGRLGVLPEIAAQYRALKNAQSGSLDACVYSAFPMDGHAVADITPVLEKRFGSKLNISVELQPDLIGGVRVVVGDEVLDTSVKARLEQMKVALTA